MPWEKRSSPVLKYSKPQIVKLSQKQSGSGACSTGSGDAGNCYIHGNNAGGMCVFNGNTAVGYCGDGNTDVGGSCSNGNIVT